MDSENKFSFKGYTFDDVLLLPGYSEVLPREVNLQSRLTRNITINIPLTSAAMDTVSGAKLAIALAREGGIAFIHKNFTIEAQAFEIQKVKRYQSNIVTKPVTLLDTQTVKEALDFQQQHGFSTFPIVSKAGIFLGLVTKNDLDSYSDEPEALLGGVMRKLDELTVTYQTDELDTTAIKKLIKENHSPKQLPVLKSRGEQILTGILFKKDIDNVKKYPNALVDPKGRLMTGASVGVTKDMIERIEALVAAGVDVVGIDTAHGHSKGVLDAIKNAKQTFPQLEIVGGNIATKAGAQALIDAGVDGVKVGVGPGSICTTRIVAGVGVPQITAIYEASKACKAAGVPVIGDGGIRFTGDVVKAIAAGADTVMAGGVFAGTDESPGETIIFEGRKYKSYRGMGSVDAMKEGSKDRYFQDVEDDIKKLVPEGIVGRVPFKGSVSDVVYQYVGGLRAGMGYCGARTIGDLQKAEFTVITSAGVKESHPHDVTITKEAPNYNAK